ncbi:unnamed protein product, partial [marine sediment metagenome]
NRTRILDEVSYENMQIFPLATESIVDFDYLTLDEALRERQIEIGEKGAGSVPELTVINKGNKPILIMNGEELVGARQNRTVNTDILVKGKLEVVIPVSCTEQGRWSVPTEEMEAPDYVSPIKARVNLLSSVSDSLTRGMGHISNQSTMWQAVNNYQQEHSVRSPTGAMDDVYKSKKKDIERYLDAFREKKDGWNGMAVAINNRFIGLDTFDSILTFGKVWTKLVRSYALDALNNVRESHLVKEDIEKILEKLKEAEFKVFKSVGLGYDARISSGSYIGSALIHRKNQLYGVVHLSVFNKEPKSEGQNQHTEQAEMKPASERTKFFNKKGEFRP